jgi:branched-chain amino acid transport system ATP-binding protein
MLLELTDIHAGYNGREILTGTTLRINSDEIVALIGPNGAGKSTVLKVISGFIYPKLGKIIFDGLNITGLETNKRVSMGIGYFLQGGEVFPDMSVYENFEMGGANLKKNVFKNRLDETIKLFPLLTDKLNKRAGLLSGGERQMLALGMIMLNRPKLLLLDEPSAGLAPGLVKGIMEKIVEINKTYGTAILLVEQKTGEALKIAERGYLLKNGQVAFEGTSEEIKEAISKKGGFVQASAKERELAY